MTVTKKADVEREGRRVADLLELLRMCRKSIDRDVPWGAAKGQLLEWIDEALR